MLFSVFANVLLMPLEGTQLYAMGLLKTPISHYLIVILVRNLSVSPWPHCQPPNPVKSVSLICHKSPSPQRHIGGHSKFHI